MIKELNEQNLKLEVNNGLSIIDFWTSWYGPWSIQVPILEELSQEIGKLFNANQAYKNILGS